MFDEIGVSTNIGWDPDEHPRGPEGKFAEKAGGGLSDFLEGAFESFGGKSDRETITNLTDTWLGWPTDGDAAPMWQAAENITQNDNDVDAVNTTEQGTILQLDVGEEKINKYEEYANHVQETISEEIDGDSITAHRFIHGEAAERIKNGESLPPRTLASWTTNEETLAEVAGSIGFDEAGDPIDLDDAVVVTKEVPIENIFDHHAINPKLESGGQDEVVVGLPISDDLSDGKIQTASELINEENVERGPPI